MKAKPIIDGIAKIILEIILSLFGADGNEIAAEKQPRKPEINAKTYEGRKWNENDFGVKRYIDSITLEYNDSLKRDLLKPNNLNTNIQLPCSVPLTTP